MNEWKVRLILVVVGACGATFACSDDAADTADAGADAEYTGDVAVADDGGESDAADLDAGGDTGEDVAESEDVADTADTPPDDGGGEPGDVGPGDVESDAEGGDAGPDGESGFPFELDCAEPVDGTVTFEFDVSPDAESYTVVPFSADAERWIDPQTISTPSSALIDFQEENSFQNYGLEYSGFEWIVASTIPVRPNLSHQFETGSHSFVVDTAAAEVCLYVLETYGSPTVIDLNIYLVGLDGIGLTPETAQEHEDFQSVMSSLDDIYEQVGLSLGEVRYKELPQQVVDEYRVIYDEPDIYELIAHSEYPGSTEDSALSVNLFITEQFVYDAIGLAMGIPGIPGYHESLVSGVAMTGEYIGIDDDNNLFTAIAIAHEVGHFLGLFHTSETDGQSFDGLDDTPECDNLNAYQNCPDAQNVMFPYIDFDTTELSDDQGTVMHVNPLTK